MDVHARDLRYFAVAAEELHFTRAAERLSVSQPALSKQIRALERQLGVALFARDRRGVALTAAGRALLPHACRVLDAWDEAWEAVEAAKAEQGTTLVVGTSVGSGSGCGELLPAIRAGFAAACPGATIQVRHADWADPAAGLVDGTSDVAFTWLPLPQAERFAHVVVAEQPRLVAMPCGHRLAARATVDVAELLDEALLALPAETGPLRADWLAAHARGGPAPRIGAEVTGAQDAYDALTAGLGLALLPAAAAAQVVRVAHGDVVTRPVRGVAPSPFALAWPRTTAAPLARAYVAACRRAVTAHPVAAERGCDAAERD